MSFVSVVVFVVLCYAVRRDARSTEADQSREASGLPDQSPPHNWLIVRKGEGAWTTYSPVRPIHDAYDEYSPTCVYAIDEVRVVNLCSKDKSSACIKWKYNVEKVKRLFSWPLINPETECYIFGDIPEGITQQFAYKAFSRSGNCGSAAKFFSEKDLWDAARRMPIDIISLEYKDLRPARFRSFT